MTISGVTSSTYSMGYEDDNEEENVIFLRWASDNIDAVGDNVDEEGYVIEGTRTTNGGADKDVEKVIICVF